ncbi:hypothetical protein [Legionella parisiensis]|uniref:Coiled-coil protein n=1 Tax=Legionella parisiensis TaxID=45071 RepID=A0A1E5JMX4_9GAMM|nr:hypothetical protein [Legionella parisiensis]KTD44347.1 coiled-coil protein [Legionella parisiensis]OEH45895.1 hypothetical protein lpari_03083 [Legionella parisiensis]STX71973.1 coiled-coil protein [Legionella parisiensis]
MAKKENARLKNGNRSKQPDSNSRSQRFFNQKKITPSLEMQGAQKTQHPQEISLQTTTDILLAAILQELKTQNMIELLKLKTQQEQEQEELQAAEKMQEQDQARFEEIRHTMYA